MEEQIQKIKTLEMQLVEEKITAEANLKACKDKLPTLHASKFLGEITATEMASHKTEITKLLTFIQDVPLVLEGLQVRREAVLKDLTAVKKKKDRHEAETRFEELKNQITHSVVYDRHLDSDLRSTSAKIGKQKEAGLLIKSWKYQVERTKGMGMH